MRFLKLVFASLMFVLSIEHSAYSQSKAEAAVNNFISKQAKENNVKEYKDAREVLQGDVNGDGKEDLIVLYTLDGFKKSISYIKYLAVFLNDGEKFHYADSLAVSGVMERLFKLKSIDHGIINLETLEYLEREGNHYRISGKMHFVLSAGKIKESAINHFPILDEP